MLLPALLVVATVAAPHPDTPPRSAQASGSRSTAATGGPRYHALLPSLLSRFLLCVPLPAALPVWPMRYTAWANGGRLGGQAVDDGAWNATVDLSVKRYIGDLISAVRMHPHTVCGPCATTTTVVTGAAKGHARLHNRTYVTLDDVKAVFTACVCHRVSCRASETRVANEVLGCVPVRLPAARD